MGRIHQWIKALLEHWKVVDANPMAACPELWIQPCYKVLNLK